jgi:hypothetical protein
MSPNGGVCMSKTDVESVNHEYDKWVKERADDLPEDIDTFEAFCAETLLKDYNLSDIELLSGIVGRSRDGGCDAFFFFVGGRLVKDDDFLIPEQKGMTAQLIFMQAKRGDGFSCLQVDRLNVLTDDVLDTNRPQEKHQREYHNKLLGLIKLFKSIHKKLNAPRLVIDYYYVTTIDADEDEDCRKSVANLVRTIKVHFSRAEIHDFHFINAARLYNLLFERPEFERHLQFAELMDCTEGYLGLVKLQDFYSFVKGDDGELIERIFDENVRGFQLDTKVNESILHSLTHSNETPEFWLLNNGITILSPDAEVQGGKRFRISDPQIVNGLQTSRQIFDYFKAGENIPTDDKRRIVIRVIQTADEQIREAVIRATNNQNPMPAEALYTTFRTHKQLEILFEKHGLYYERRKGYWRDKRKPMSKIISPRALVQAVLAVVEGLPGAARGRPLDYINKAESRYKLFGHDDYDESKSMRPEVASLAPFDFNVYLRSWQIVRRIEKFLNLPRLRLDNEAKRNLLYYMARCATCASTKNAYCPASEVAKIDVSKLTDEVLKGQCLPYVKRLYKRFGGNDEAGKNPKMAAALSNWLIKTYSPPHKSPSKKGA